MKFNKLLNMIKIMVDRWPFMTKREHLRQKKADWTLSNMKIDAARTQHRVELEKVTQKIEGILDRAMNYRWRYDSDGSYALMITFNPDLWAHGYQGSQDLEIIAHQFARLVEKEIRSCKFIQSAQELERDMYKNNRLSWYVP